MQLTDAAVLREDVQMVAGHSLTVQMDIVLKIVPVVLEQRQRKKLKVGHTSNYCIETHDLSFGYGRAKKVFSSLNLKIPEGSVFGILGPNGSGKSTIFKLFLHLVKALSGSISYWGDTNWSPSLFYRIAGTVDAPAYYPHLTVLEHFEMLDIIFRKGKGHIEDILELVDLTSENDRKAGKLSFGMKQRLAIGLALFRDPDILILDEPINGLDPNGIIDMRSLFQKIHSMEKTIITSGHVISEMEKVCSHIGIIESGEILYQGAAPENESLESFYLRHTSK